MGAVARLLRHFVSDPHGCAYLPAESASLEYRLMLGVTASELEVLLAHGWRRFGPAYFRPVCARCSECVPLRIPVAQFRLSKQQRRVLKNNADLRLEIGQPQVDEQRLALYHRWHAMQGTARGWGADTLDAQEYYHQFAFPHPSVREYSYWDDSGGAPKLLAIGIVDETPQALSAVFTFHEPEAHKRSLGTASVLFQLAEAQQTGKRWLYLGYRVVGCKSSEYKARFQPHELLSGWPALDQTPLWTAAPSRWDSKSEADLEG